MQYKILFSLGV